MDGGEKSAGREVNGGSIEATMTRRKNMLQAGLMAVLIHALLLLLRQKGEGEGSWRSHEAPLASLYFFPNCCRAASCCADGDVLVEVPY